MKCRYDREAQAHLLRTHRPECIDPTCKGCQPCTHDDDGVPVRHCRTRRRCTSHLGWGEHTCPECLGKIRDNLGAILDGLALMPREATMRGVDSEPANLAGPHADYVTASWRTINAHRAGHLVEELDMRDPYTCLTFWERNIREDLDHDGTVLVSPTVAEAAAYLDWVLTDLARMDGQADTLAELLAATSILRGHVESALRDSRAPERGIPCPDCVADGINAERLTRHYGHWCTNADCEQVHYLDDSGDFWRCPRDPDHEWSHDVYEKRLKERRAQRVAG